MRVSAALGALCVLACTHANPLWLDKPAQQVFRPLSPEDEGGISLRRVPRLEAATISSLRHGLSNGSFTAVELTAAYIQRISDFSDLRATLNLNPFALTDASKADELRRELEGDTRDLPLLGIPFMVKDNIAVPAHACPTTAGSWALLNSTTIAPAPVVARLLDAGAILLGTTNMDEFAQAKGYHPMGWSSRGGQMKSIFGDDGSDIVAQGYGDICGSSGGSALVVSLGMAAFALGTQTGFSIVCPASRAGVVGFKPGRGGEAPTKGTIPISKHIDAVGPIARTVDDADILWRIIRDKFETPSPEDLFVDRWTWSRPLRVGIPKRKLWELIEEEGPMPPEILGPMQAVVDRLQKEQPGSFKFVVKDIPNVDAAVGKALKTSRGIVIDHDLKLGIDAYLANWTTTNAWSVQSLSDIIDFNKQYSALELPPGPFAIGSHPPDTASKYSDQSLLVTSDSLQVVGAANATYRHALKEMERIAYTDSWKLYFEDADIDVAIVPTDGFSGSYAATARIPQITVPLSFFPSSYPLADDEPWPVSPHANQPVGLSIVGPRGRKGHEMVLAAAKKIEALLWEDVEQATRERSLRLRRSVRERLQ